MGEIYAIWIKNIHVFVIILYQLRLSKNEVYKNALSYYVLVNILVNVIYYFYFLIESKAQKAIMNYAIKSTNTHGNVYMQLYDYYLMKF